mgnify:CR=1 FL=1
MHDECYKDNVERLLEDSFSDDDGFSEFEISEIDDSSAEDFLERINKSEDDEDDENSFFDYSDDVLARSDPNATVVSRSGFQWSTKHRLTTKRLVHNIIKNSPGILGDALNVTTILGTF